MNTEKVKIKEIVPDDKYGIMSLEVGQVIENRCKALERDELSKKIRGAVQHYTRQYGRKFSTKKTVRGVAIKREA